MDINFLMKQCIVQLGLPALSMEKYYPQIKEILMTDTLPTFSQFFPYTYIMKLDLTKMKYSNIGDGWEIYYLRDKFLEDNGLDVISVIDVSGASYFDTWNAPLPTFDVEAMIIEGAASSIRSQLNISNKAFEFMPPNRLKLKGYSGTGEVFVTCKVPYPNVGTVPMSVSIPLTTLAKLDIKCWLYPELKMYNQLETADGTIDLKIDDWADAPSERANLLDDWMNKAYPNMVRQSKPQWYE